MRLTELLHGAPFHVVAGDPDVVVNEISVDSRTTQPGDVFVCLPGYKTEGGETRADRHEFIPAAIAAGAAAIVISREVAIPPGVTVVRVDDGLQAVAAMACARYGHPSRHLTVVGITGTSGKTSTSYFVDAVLRGAGWRNACLGTIEYRLGDETLPAHQTTPEAPELQRLLRRAVTNGCRAVVMEVSSHALELRRVAGIEFDAAVFTNISQDHLNFHPDMEHYLRAKCRLFEGLSTGTKRGTAVVNIDDASSERVIAINHGALLTYGRRADAHIRASQIELGLRGTKFRVHTPAGEATVRLPHLGEYQVHNALAAVAVGVTLGIDLGIITGALGQAPAIPGRFEWIDCGQDFGVAVDYAHKPDALERLLHSARALQPKRIITVFGCGGDRDRGKRPLMGRIAAELSDVTIVTSDNPRSEEPEAIIAEICAGVPAERGPERLITEADRGAAIARAIAMARSGDLILIAGKGHETYQLFKDRRIHFDDREQARAALQAAQRL